MRFYPVRSIFNLWHLLAIVFLSCFASSALTQDTNQPAVMLVSLRQTTDRQALRLVGRPDWPREMRRQRSADTMSWDRFEEEFAPKETTNSAVKRQIVNAKYDLDNTLFAVDRFVKSIRDHADYEVDRGELRHTPADLRGDYLDKPRVKLDLDLTRGKPYIGARLVIPFGN